MYNTRPHSGELSVVLFIRFDKCRKEKQAKEKTIWFTSLYSSANFALNVIK